MNKTVSINLSGQVFQIDEQAYDKLKLYLENIRARFSTADGGAEIIADIESRIAELFFERLNDKKQVITLADVEAMMQAMGKPEEFEVAGGSGSEQTTTKQSSTTRRLFRNPDEKVLGGVCSGLSAYFGINDPLWMRLLFIISPFLTMGTALFVYLILWIIIPEAKTSSEKLQMRGENVNISNIEKTIREDLNDLGQRINNISNGDATTKAKGFLESFVDFCIRAVELAIKIVGKLFGLALILAGSCILIGFAITLLLPAELMSISIEALYPAIFATQIQFAMAAAGLCLVVGIPALALIFSGFHLLLKTKRSVKGLGLAFVALWVAGIILMSISISKTAADFQQTETIRKEIPLTQPMQDTLVLEGISKKLSGNDAFYELPEVGEFVATDSALIFTEHVKLDIKKSSTGEYELIQTYKASGKKSVYAGERASNIRHEITQNGSILVFGEYFSVPKDDHYRNQEVVFLLKVPEGKAVYLSQSVVNILYDVKNTRDMYDRDMAEHTWMMLPEGLTCLDCSEEDIESSAFPQGDVSREFQLDDFSSIEAHGAFNLEVKQGEFSVIVNGNQRFADNVEVIKKGNSLVIEVERGAGWGRNSGSITVTLPELNEIEITGANTAVISGFKQDKMTLEVRSASKVDLKSSVEELAIEEEGASTITLSGTGKALRAEVNGSSSLNAFNYTVDKCDIEVNGESEVEVNVQDEMTAEANGASKIRYKGLPKISSDVTGYSSMKPEK